jgi:hypothetical protein
LPFWANHKNACPWLFVCKGQIISKYLFGVFNFFQKRNKNTLHTRGWSTKFATGLNIIIDLVQKV